MAHTERFAEVSFQCGKCGSRLGWTDNVTAETLIVCENCGEEAGRYSDLEDAAADAATTEIDRMLKGVFKIR